MTESVYPNDQFGLAQIAHRAHTGPAVQRLNRQQLGLDLPKLGPDQEPAYKCIGFSNVYILEQGLWLELGFYWV